MNQQSDAIFSLTLHLAVVVSLVILAIGLAMDIPPLVALLRSMAALGIFILLGWPVSWLWQTPEPVETTTDNEQ